MAESAEINNPDAESVKVADRIMEEYYRIEEMVFKLNSVEATQFLVDTLKEVIADLERDSVEQGIEAG